MATIRLIPSTYQLSNTSYLRISNTSNMYTNTDSTTYATVSHTRTSTTSYYVYIRGFNWSSIPDNATITSAIIKVKAYVKSASSYAPYLYNSTSSLSRTLSPNIGTSTTTSSLDITSDIETYKGYGSNFGIRLRLNRSSRNTASSLYIYGAEILIEYTLPLTNYNITSSLVKNDGVTGWISPEGTEKIEEGKNYDLYIMPDLSSTIVTITDNGIDKSVRLVKYTSPITNTVSSVIKTYTLQSGTLSSTSAKYFQNAVNNGSDTTQRQTGNGYSSSYGSTATVKYTFDFSSIPALAEIKSVRCSIRGHAESSSNTNEHMDCQLFSGTSAISDMKSFKSTGTTNTVIELTQTMPIDRQELDSLWLSVIVGYYGGAIDGATVEVDYQIGWNPPFYSFSITNVSTAHTLVVTMSPGSTPTLYVKINGNWVAAKSVYKKINGVWVEQTNLSGVVDSNMTYIKGN